MQSDTYKTGKQYPKLNAYKISTRQGSINAWTYFSSSVQFKTAKSYESYLRNEYLGVPVIWKVTRGEI